MYQIARFFIIGVSTVVAVKSAANINDRRIQRNAIQQISTSTIDAVRITRK